MAVKNIARQCVGDDRRWLARLHACELVFLEIGVDPEPVRRNNGQQVCPLRDIGADLGGAIADITIDG